MSISTADLNKLNTLNTTSTSNNLPATVDKTAGADQTQASAADSSKQVKLTPEIAKQQLNVSILQASLEVTFNSQNDPLALVYKSAIENLNDILKPQLGDNAIQNAASQDNSPEATAGRILSFIKSAYQLFSLSSTKSADGSDSADGSGSTIGTDPGAAFDNFMSQIQKGVDMGFGEARNILSGLNVLNGDIASNIDKTYEILKKGIADFVASIKNPQGDDGSTPATGDGSGSTSSTSSTTVSVSISVTATHTEVTNY